MKETKKVKAYAFRQFQRTTEKERLKEEKIKYFRVKEQIITYKTRKYSTIVYRNSKGRFIKSPYKKIEKEKAKFVPFIKSEYYKASVFAEIPYHGKYYWFGIIVIDKKENINIEKMKDDLKDLLHNELHYSQSDWWFDLTCSIEHPQPHSANRAEKYEEKWSETKK